MLGAVLLHASTNRALGELISNLLAKSRMPKMTFNSQFQSIHAFRVDTLLMVPLDEAREHSIWNDNKAFVRKLSFANKHSLTKGQKLEPSGSLCRQNRNVGRSRLIISNSFEAKWVTILFIELGHTNSCRVKTTNEVTRKYRGKDDKGHSKVFYCPTDLQTTRLHLNNPIIIHNTRQEQGNKSPA